MAAYIIVDIDITDSTLYQEYKELAAATVEQYGGKYLVRGGTVEALEGGWLPKRLVILEFATMEQARAWWASEEYRIPKSIRQRASVANMFLVQGA